MNWGEWVELGELDEGDKLGNWVNGVMLVNW